MQLQAEDKRDLFGFLLGAVAGAILDPLLGWYVGPHVPEPTEQYINTPDLIHFSIDGGVTAAGYFMQNPTVMFTGLGMLTQKLTNKIVLWIWGAFKPGYPVWQAPGQTGAESTWHWPITGPSYRNPSPSASKTSQRLPFQQDLTW